MREQCQRRMKQFLVFKALMRTPLSVCDYGLKFVMVRVTPSKVQI
jgi:hypothetical protein